MPLTEPSTRRARWRKSTGQFRALFADWCPVRRVWVCQLSGFGMAPQRFEAYTQTGVIGICRARTAAWGGGWTTQRRADAGLCWDGRPDPLVDTQLDLDPPHLLAVAPSLGTQMGLSL